MAQNDSLDKIVRSYFVAICDEPFTYKNKSYNPVTLHVSALLLRDGICVPGCGGCCFKFTLDYIPSEAEDHAPYELKERIVSFNGKDFKIFTDFQEDNKGAFCKNLIRDPKHPLYDKYPAGCGIHPNKPFSCDFEMIRFFNYVNNEKARINTSKFARGWNLTRIDGNKGAMCEIEPATEKSRNEAVRKLKRLKEWVEYFQLKTKIDTIIYWAERVPLNNVRPLIIYNDTKSQIFS